MLMFVQVVLSNADVVTDETISRVAAINTGFVAVLTCTGGTKYETGIFAPLSRTMSFNNKTFNPFTQLHHQKHLMLTMADMDPI